MVEFRNKNWNICIDRLQRKLQNVRQRCYYKGVSNFYLSFYFKVLKDLYSSYRLCNSIGGSIIIVVNKVTFPTSILFFINKINYCLVHKNTVLIVVCIKGIRNNVYTIEFEFSIIMCCNLRIIFIVSLLCRPDDHEILDEDLQSHLLKLIPHIHRNNFGIRLLSFCASAFV